MDDRDAIREFLPQTGWLADYIRLTDGVAACPRFRFFSAACVVGAAVNNKVWITRGTTGSLLPPLFPNPWVILLAPPGRGYKTSTINMAVNILKAACPEARVLSDRITPEAITQALSEPKTPKEMIRIGPRDATGLIKAPELSVFFGKQQYNASLISLITDLYDYRETWRSETIARGRDILRNVCISIIGGSTPAWLQSMLPHDAFTGGFMSRFILVEMPPTYYKRVAFPVEPDKKEWGELVNRLSMIGRIRGEMTWADEVARRRYRDMYESYVPTGDEQIDAYRERETEQILRIAMLIALTNDRMTVSVEDLNTANNLIRLLERETSPRIERLGTHPRMELVQRICDILRMHGELSEADLLRMVYRSLTYGEAQFYEALGILRKTGMITVNGRPGAWRFSLRERR